MRRRSRLVLLISTAFALLAPAAAQAGSPVESVAVHVTLHGPGTIVDGIGGGTVCAASAGTLAIQVTTCDSTATAVASTFNGFDFQNYQVVFIGHGPIVNGSLDDAGWQPSSWAGSCTGDSSHCANRVDACAAAGAVRTCSNFYSLQAVPLRIEPVMNDQRAPTTSIATGPGPADTGNVGTPYLTPDGRARFTFTTNENQESPTYQCSVDGGASSPCAGSFTTGVLSSNFHTLDVKATDKSGLLGPTFHRKWDNELDPKIVFSSAPGAFLRATAFAFAWHAVRVDTTGYFCRFDSTALADFNPCIPPFTRSGLAQGAHHLDVQARVHAINGADVLGSIGSSRFTVDTIAPNTRIDFGPDNGLITNQSSQTLFFTGLGGSSGFQCSLDKGAFAPCGSPDRLVGLAVGPHTFSVRAVDAAGNVDPTPETRSFRVISHFPSLGADSQMTVKFFRKYTLVTHLYVTKAPTGSKITVSCVGKGCKKKKVSQTVKKAKKKIDLVKLLKHAHLGSKALVTVQITKPGFNGVVVRFRMKIRVSPSKSTLCLPAGTTKPKGSC